MFKVICGDKVKEYNSEVLLSQALDDLGISKARPCGGRGVCGKCRVVANGREVLSCTTYVSTDTYIDYIQEENDIHALTDGYMPDFSKNPLIEDGYALAVDIGTTTVAGYLYKFPEGKCIKEQAVLNPQTKYGADVISRIEFCNNGGLDTLRQCVCDTTEKLKDDKDIKKYVITGNTTMLHIFMGLDPKGIAVAPFLPKTLFGKWYGEFYLPRCIGAYVGADITCAILSGGMCDSKTSFLVDVGTNGEMALWHNGKMLCCSTAAGPAFEGAGISMGMQAIPGAINRVYIEDGQVNYTTIDGERAKGICGSGLIDAIACMRELWIIDESGYMEEDFEIGDSGVFITIADVRAVQLAKSAIRSGIDTLLNEADVSAEDIEKFYIAGGFGSYIDKNSAAKIGLIPIEVLEKTVTIGNAAGSGAAMILQSRECLEKAEAIGKSAVEKELSTNPYFMEKYIENMMF